MRDQVEFTCKLCGTKHISSEKNEIGVFVLPSTITTSRDSESRWYFHCVKCKNG